MRGVAVSALPGSRQMWAQQRPLSPPEEDCLRDGLRRDVWWHLRKAGMDSAARRRAAVSERRQSEPAEWWHAGEDTGPRAGRFGRGEVFCRQPTLQAWLMPPAAWIARHEVGRMPVGTPTCLHEGMWACWCVVSGVNLCDVADGSPRLEPMHEPFCWLTRMTGSPPD